MIVMHKYIFCEIFETLRQVEVKIICNFKISFKIMDKHSILHF
jgi:hypothetical protein